MGSHLGEMNLHNLNYQFSRHLSAGWIVHQAWTNGMGMMGIQMRLSFEPTTDSGVHIVIKPEDPVVWRPKI